MNKKNYIIIGTTIVLFILAILVILLIGNKKTWIDEVLSSQSYNIIMTDCNGREKVLDKNTINYFSENWSSISDNGPWTGDNTACYKTVTFSYETNGIVNKKEILLLDDISFALIESTSSTYYTNAMEIIKELNNDFIR